MKPPCSRPSLLLLACLFVLGSSSAEDEPQEEQVESEEARSKGELISLSLRDADLRDVLLSFAELADVDIVIDPDIQGKVTVELKDVPWDQALAVILKSQGLGMEVSRSNPRLWTIKCDR